MLKVDLGNDQLAMNVSLTSNIVSEPDHVQYINFGTQFTKDYAV